jgi:hypothetical protein
MITYSDVTKSVGDQLVDGFKQFETRSVAAIETLSDAATKLMPELPGRASNPILGSLPTASEIVAANFAFVERVVKAQKEVLLHVLDVVPAPVVTEAAPNKKAAAKA